MAYIRQNSDIIKGGKIMEFIGDTPQPIAFATNHTLSLTRNTQEISSKDHGDATAVLPTTQSWEVTTENLMSAAGYEQVLDAYLNATPLTIYFGASNYKNYPTSSQDPASEQGIVDVDNAANWNEEAWPSGATLATSLNLQGTAYITSLNVNAPNGENATYTATFTGTGQIGRVVVS